MALPQTAAHTPGQLFAERHTGMSINGLGNNTAFDSAVAQGEPALSDVSSLSERIRSPAGTVKQVTPLVLLLLLASLMLTAALLALVPACQRMHYESLFGSSV